MTDLNKLDWSLIETFVAVAEQGSLSAAARQLGSSQPTVGRQIKSIETQLGVDLFHRSANGFDLTASGMKLLPAAQAMNAAYRDLMLATAGQDTDLSGTVCITASEMVSVYHLPEIIADIRQREPQIQIEVIATDDSRNLLYREADIAIRMFQPNQLDLIARHLGDLNLGVFASKDYIARRGPLRSLEDLQNHDFIGLNEQTLIIDNMRKFGLDAKRDWFSVRCDDPVGYWRMVQTGCGIGFAQKSVARKDPDIIELNLGFPLPTLPVWLTAHEAIRHTPRVKRVWDLLVEGLKPLLS
jgi:DNA-binding transcriptional LysR family regulator